MFHTLKLLHVLHLSNNHIAIIEKHAFWGLHALTSMELENNNIAQIDLTGVGARIIVNLQGNNIQHFYDIQGLPLARNDMHVYSLALQGKNSCPSTCGHVLKPVI